VMVLSRVRVGEAGLTLGANRREFLSSSLPIRSILRDVGCGPMLGAARLFELVCWRLLVLAIVRLKA
jgi:hypothetical protein